MTPNLIEAPGLAFERDSPTQIYGYEGEVHVFQPSVGLPCLFRATKTADVVKTASEALRRIAEHNDFLPDDFKRLGNGGRSAAFRKLAKAGRKLFNFLVPVDPACLAAVKSAHETGDGGHPDEQLVHCPLSAEQNAFLSYLAPDGTGLRPVMIFHPTSNIPWEFLYAGPIPISEGVGIDPKLFLGNRFLFVRVSPSKLGHARAHDVGPPLADPLANSAATPAEAGFEMAHLYDAQLPMFTSEKLRQWYSVGGVRRREMRKLQKKDEKLRAQVNEEIAGLAMHPLTRGIHVDCHGTRDDEIAPANIVLKIREAYELRNSDIESWVLKACGERLGFLNVCSSARGAQQGAETVAEALNSSGMGSVIAAAADVSQELAAAMSHSIYERLCAGHTVGEALAGARLALADEYHDNPGLMLWTLYGKYNLRLKERPAHGGAASPPVAS